MNLKTSIQNWLYEDDEEKKIYLLVSQYASVCDKIEELSPLYKLCEEVKLIGVLERCWQT